MHAERVQASNHTKIHCGSSSHLLYTVHPTLIGDELAFHLNWYAHTRGYVPCTNGTSMFTEVCLR